VIGRGFYYLFVFGRERSWDGRVLNDWEQGSSDRVHNPLVTSKRRSCSKSRDIDSSHAQSTSPTSNSTSNDGARDLGVDTLDDAGGGPPTQALARGLPRASLCRCCSLWARRSIDRHLRARAPRPSRRRRRLTRRVSSPRKRCPHLCPSSPMCRRHPASKRLRR
jgi:hypothetical protein